MYAGSEQTSVEGALRIGRTPTDQCVHFVAAAGLAANWSQWTNLLYMQLEKPALRNQA